jgi:hypothetical protein
MNAILKTSNNGVRAVAYQNPAKIKSASPIVKNNSIDLADVYNEQVWLSNEFMQTMANTINDIEFAYPMDARKIKQMIHTYTESSLKILKARMDKVNDTKKVVIETEKKNPYSHWTESWIEQTQHNHKKKAHTSFNGHASEKHTISWVGEWTNQTLPEAEVVYCL